MTGGRRAAARATQGAMLASLLLVAAGVLPTASPGPRAEGTMHIDFERSGGVAGVRLTARVDSDTLPPDEAARLRRLVDDANVFALPARLEPATPRPDAFQYLLTIREGDRAHTVTIGEGAAPPPVRALLDYLTAEARKRR